MTLHLTRAMLDKDAGLAALAPLLDPPNPDRALDAHHRLIWTLFPGENAVRDFLWRADGNGRFFILSHRAPVQSGLFRTLDTSDFAPVLAPGDRLSFAPAGECDEGPACPEGRAWPQARAPCRPRDGCAAQHAGADGPRLR